MVWKRFRVKKNRNVNMKYAYFLSENLESDCFSISFEKNNDVVNFFGWDFSFDLSNTHYIVFDETRGDMIRRSFLSPHYENSDNIQYFKFEKISEDLFRNILSIKLLDEIKDFDVRKFKRDLRIEKLLN